MVQQLHTVPGAATAVHAALTRPPPHVMADSRLCTALVVALCLVSAASCTSADTAHGLGRKLLYHDEPIHNETVIGGLDAYVSQPVNTSTNAAVVLLTDVFGWSTPEIRQWADALAEEGFIAIVPDFFRGEPLGPNPTLADLAPWTERHPRNQTEQDLPRVFAAIRQQYPNITKISVEGFCWGGLYALVACGGAQPLADACVSYHGAPITPQDVQNITKPTLFVLADPKLDLFFNQTLLDTVRPVIEQRNASGVPTAITVYANEPHGFALGLHHTGGSATPPSPETYAAAEAAADAAFDEGLTWLVTYLNITDGMAGA